jgi:hypothetical protein
MQELFLSDERYFYNIKALSVKSLIFFKLGVLDKGF